MQVQRLESWTEADPLRSEWNALANGIPFRQWEWLGTWWQYYGAGRDAYVLTVRDADGRLAGIAPWYRQSSPGFCRVLQFLGSGETCSDHLGILCADQDRAEVTRALAEWLVAPNRGDGPDGWELLHLDGVAGTDETVLLLRQQLEERGCTVHARSGIHLWRIPLPESWDAYRAQLSKPNRRHVRVVQERLVDSGLVSIRVASTPAELAQGWAMLVDLHQRRRHELGQPGCFASPSFAGFARQTADAFLQRGQLELLWVEQSGEPLAVQLGFLGGRTTYAYQVGIDPAKRAESPGWLVHSESIKRAIHLGHTTFDFLRGDEPHKHRMGAQPIPLLTLRIVPPRLGPRVIHTAWATGDAVKSWLKAGLQLAGMRSSP